MLFWITLHGFAQAPTPSVEALFQRYFQALGSQENRDLVTNIVQHTKSFATSSSAVDTDYESIAISSESDLELIQFADFKRNQLGTISKTGKLFTKTIQDEGRLFIEDALGKRTEMELGGSSEPVKSRYFDYAINPNSEILSDTLFRSEKADVVKVKDKITMSNQLSSTSYYYFSKASGLLLGYKQVMLLRDNSTYQSITSLSDYQEVAGILFPQKTVNTTLMQKPGSSETQINIQMITQTQLNVDLEDFQKNCFKKPEACFKKYN